MLYLSNIIYHLCSVLNVLCLYLKQMCSKVDHYRIHANPPALGWNTHPDSSGMVYVVNMY